MKQANLLISYLTVRVSLLLTFNVAAAGTWQEMETSRYFKKSPQ